LEEVEPSSSRHPRRANALHFEGNEAYPRAAVPRVELEALRDERTDRLGRERPVDEQELPPKLRAGGWPLRPSRRREPIEGRAAHLFCRTTGAQRVPTTGISFVMQWIEPPTTIVDSLRTPTTL